MIREEKDTELLTLIKESRSILGELTRATKRSNEIKKAADEHARGMPLRFDKVSYIMGAKWADENPQSPWISVKDDLPYRHLELVEPIPVESPFESETISVLVIDNKGYSWFDNMVLDKNIWKWEHLDSEPAYWMPIPELPKE